MPDAAIVCPVQLSLDMTKSVLSELIVPIASPVLPVLLIVKVWGDEDEPTLTLPKSTGDAGDTPILAAFPIPLRVIKKIGVAGSSDGMVRVAPLDPKVDGVNVT